MIGNSDGDPDGWIAVKINAEGGIVMPYGSIHPYPDKPKDGPYCWAPFYIDTAPAPSCAPGEVERHLRDELNDSEELSDGTVNINAEHAARLNADVDGWEAQALTIEQAWDELVNVDDRTSPEEYPDMCLITREELADFMQRAALSPQGLDARHSCGCEADPIDGLDYVCDRHLREGGSPLEAQGLDAKEAGK